MRKKRCPAPWFAVLKAAIVIFVSRYVDGGLAAKLAAAVFGLAAGMLGYLVGFALNRIVLRGLAEPHPIHSKVGSTSSFKLWDFLL